jgi:hypothetical protein
VDRGRRILAHCAVVIAAGMGASYLDHRPEPVRAPRSSPSVAVPGTVAAAAKSDLLDLTGPGSVRAVLSVGLRSQVDDKPILTSWRSEGERLVVNREHTLLDPRVTVNERPASAVAKQSRLS